MTEQININDNFGFLYKKLKLIESYGWIKGMNKGKGSAGLTLENLLGISQNEFPIPDFMNIELKTKKNNCVRPITLFSAVPDGPGFHEVERLRCEFGYPHLSFDKYKVLGCNICCNRTTKIKSGFYLKLYVNREFKKILIIIYDKNMNLVEQKTYWDFDTLEKKINQKLKYMAFISYISKKENDRIYFKYIRSEFLELRDFETFIDLIESGRISLNIKIGIYTDIKRFGKTYDHGSGFVISKYNLNKLYKKHNIDI